MLGSKRKNLEHVIQYSDTCKQIAFVKLVSGNRVYGQMLHV